MSIYPNVTEEDLASLEKLANQQKNEKTRKIKNRIFKQTYDIKLAETFEPITKRIDEIVKVVKELDSPNIVNNFVLEPPPGVTITDDLFTTLGLMSRNSNKFKTVKDNQGRPKLNDINFTPVGGNDMKIGENIYEITPEIQKALTNTSYNFDKMSDKDILICARILDEIKYKPYDDNKSKRRDYIKTKLLSRVQKILNPPIAAIASGESDEYESLESDLEGNGTKTIVVPSDSNEIWTRLQVLQGLKLAGHTDILIEASQLLDALFKKGEIKTEQQYRNAIDKFKYQNYYQY